MDRSEWCGCSEKDHLLKDKNIAVREYAERAFALLQDARRDSHLYRRLWNEATAAQKAAKEAEAAFVKHVEEHECRSVAKIGEVRLA
jgi:hypothetical protein